MRPPGVETVALVEEAEGVDEAGVDEVLETLALFIGEAAFADVGLGPGEVVGSVGHVEVAAEHYRLGRAAEFAGLEALAVLEKGRIPVVVAQRDAREVIFGVHGVDGDQVELLVFGGEDAALGVGVAVFVFSHGVFGEKFGGEIMAGANRLGFREDGGAGIAFFLSGINVTVVTIFTEFNFFGLGLGFL